MEPPFGVIAIYAALVVWVGLLIYGFRTRSYTPFLMFGVALLLYLNIGYFIFGVTDSIAFFISIYDVLDNVGLAPGETVAAMASCPDNACTVWGDRYTNHPAWGVAFHDRFLTGDALRSNLLLTHLGFNSIVFVLMHIQLARPGFGASIGMHRMLGRISFVCITLGTIAAIWLASQHGDVEEYGASWSTWGFYSMSLCVYGCAVMGVLTIRRGDTAGHRVWMFRFIGSMWGAFWLFRVMLFVLGPILRDVEAASLLICIWFSAPLGILIAELVRRRIDAPGRTAAVAAE